MKIELDQKDFANLYAKAEAGFKECIENNENDFLEDEIDIPEEEIETKENYIQIQFFGRDNEHFIVEANLSLYSPDGEEIGWYCLHEDENGEAVDDYLVYE